MPQKQLQMLTMMIRTNPMMLYSLGINPARIMKELELGEKAQSLRDMSPSQKEEQDRAAWSSWLSDYIKILEQDAKPYNKSDYELQRTAVMNANNPRLVLRNWMAQAAIEKAEEGDYSETKTLFEALCDPYGTNEDNMLCKVGESESKSSSSSPTEVEDSSSAGPSCEKCSKPKPKSDAYYGPAPDWAHKLRVS